MIVNNNLDSQEIHSTLVAQSQITPTNNQPTVNNWSVNFPLALLLILIVSSLIVAFLRSFLCICK
ncbi:MAG: hypothetical protein AAF298_18545, partial [Cyanobacteria bacterium P01_A01_bin.40]